MINVSLLQWNIWYLEDINNIAKFLNENKTDIICAQELTINFDKQSYIDTPNYLAKKLGYHIYFQDISFDGKDMKLANAILSKYPITKTRTVRVNREQGSGNYDDENRAYIEAIIDIQGVLLTVGTVHMSYTHKFEPSERKLIEADMLVGAIQTNKSNFILAGDLNALPGSKVLEKVRQGLVNCGPEYTQNTWTTKPFSYNGFEVNELDYRLDYVLATKDINVINAKTLSTEYSDHLPILVEFSL